jgi:hypothetical protein
VKFIQGSSASDHSTGMKKRLSERKAPEVLRFNEVLRVCVTKKHRRPNVQPLRSLNKVMDLQHWSLVCVERWAEMVNLWPNHGGAEEIFEEVMVRVRQLAQKLQ